MEKSPDFGQDLNLEVPLFIDHDMEIDDHGVFNLKLSIYIDANSPTARRISVPFYSIVDYLIEVGDESRDHAKLYDICNELVRESERIREVADRIESSVSNVADLFNTSYVPTT